MKDQQKFELSYTIMGYEPSHIHPETMGALRVRRFVDDPEEVTSIVYLYKKPLEMRKDLWERRLNLIGRKCLLRHTSERNPDGTLYCPKFVRMY